MSTERIRMVSLAFICALYPKKTHSALDSMTRKVMLGWGVGSTSGCWIPKQPDTFVCGFFAVVSLPLIALFWLSEDLLYGLIYFALAFLCCYL